MFTLIKLLAKPKLATVCGLLQHLLDHTDPECASILLGHKILTQYGLSDLIKSRSRLLHSKIEHSLVELAPPRVNAHLTATATFTITAFRRGVVVVTQPSLTRCPTLLSFLSHAFD